MDAELTTREEGATAIAGLNVKVINYSRYLFGKLHFSAGNVCKGKDYKYPFVFLRFADSTNFYDSKDFK